jgi:hypothetical protein
MNSVLRYALLPGHILGRTPSLHLLQCRDDLRLAFGVASAHTLIR